MILHVRSCNKDELRPWGSNEFGTIQKAYEHLVRCFKRGETDGQNSIVVHEGTYRISSPLHFYEKVPVAVEAAEGEKVIISGAIAVTEWSEIQINGKKAFRAPVPENIESLPFFYVNGKEACAARFPKKDWLKVTDDENSFWATPEGYDRFHYPEGGFDHTWYDPRNIMIKMIHLWVEENMPVESCDPEKRLIITSSGCHFAKTKETEYACFNVREALSEPNEFYFDRRKHELLYIPEDPGEPLCGEIPVCGSLVRFDSGASRVTLKGLSFRGSGNYLPRCSPQIDMRDPGYRDLPVLAKEQLTFLNCTKPFYAHVQAAVQVPGVIFFDDASDCKVTDCEITGCAWYGIQVYSSCSRLVFTNNHIHSMGAGGIVVNGPSYDKWMEKTSLEISRLIIKGNHIHDCGRFFMSAPGIIICNAWGCLIEDNHIHDLYYSGISCGWTWGYDSSPVREIQIHRNYIHDLGKGILSDMGGVYMLGIQPGSRVWENVIHDVSARYYGGWGLYADEGSSHIVFERNTVHHCSAEGFHQHYGRENIIRWNIFAFNDEYGITITKNFTQEGNCTPGYEHSHGLTFINNVIISDGKPFINLALSAMRDKKKFYSDSNVFYDISGRETDEFVHDNEEKSCMSLAKWQKAGFDRHSVFADPGFKNIKKLDFRLKKNSILYDFGFSEIAAPQISVPEKEADEDSDK